jgi:predicted phosphate transport protein (TIGR00153 family)
MGFNFLPKDNDFYHLLSKASDHVVKAAKIFRELVENWQLDSEKVDQIHAIEEEGDDIRRDIVDKLNHTFITPIDREDIYVLSSDLDDVIDMIQSRTDRMQIYRIKTIDKNCLHLAVILEKASIALDKAINNMKDKKNIKHVMECIAEINHLEHEGDRTIRKLLTELFAENNKMDAIEVFKLKETYEALEAAIDKCEDVACTIEGIVVKHG